MAMRQPAVRMDVNMRLAWGIVRRVPMLVVLVMHMGVLMRHGLMEVLVLMPLREMQVETDTHQERRSDQLRGDRFREQDQRQDRPHEGRRQERRAGGNAGPAPSWR